MGHDEQFIYVYGETTLGLPPHYAEIGETRKKTCKVHDEVMPQIQTARDTT